MASQSASQPTSQPVSQSASRPSNQPARLLVGQALLVPFHVPRQSMQELSSLGRSSGPGSLLPAHPTSLLISLSRRESRRWRALQRRKRKAGKGEARRRRRPREGRGEGRGELLDRELVACSLKKNWKSVALDGPEDPRRGELRGGQLWGTVGSSASSSLTIRPSVSRFLLPLFLLPSAKRSR